MHSILSSQTAFPNNMRRKLSVWYMKWLLVITVNIYPIKIDKGIAQAPFCQPSSFPQTYLPRRPSGKEALGTVSLVTIERSALLSSSVLELSTRTNIDPPPVLSLEVYLSYIEIWKFKDYF